jgi:hypothetical protein
MTKVALGPEQNLLSLLLKLEHNMDFLDKANGARVLEMLLPEGGWIIVGDDYETITWVDDRPRCTKEQFEAGFAEYKEMVLQQKQQALTNKAAAEAKLAALGLNADDLKALGL